MAIFVAMFFSVTVGTSFAILYGMELTNQIKGEETMKQYKVTRTAKKSGKICRQNISAISVEAAMHSMACRSGMTLDTLLVEFNLEVREM